MIKNIVFDIGNVLVKWDPTAVVARHFPGHPDVVQLSRSIFRSPLWLDLNLGKYTESEALQKYQEMLNIDLEKLNLLMQDIRESLVPIEHSFELLNDLYSAHYPLYALTDNVREIVTYLKNKYDFWDKFTGVVVSAEVGFLKPAPEIYQHLLSTYQLNPAETVFIDDMLVNVDGAKFLGMQGIHFQDTHQCKKELEKLHIIFSN